MRTLRAFWVGFSGLSLGVVSSVFVLACTGEQNLGDHAGDAGTETGATDAATLGEGLTDASRSNDATDGSNAGDAGVRVDAGDTTRPTVVLTVTPRTVTVPSSLLFDVAVTDESPITKVVIYEGSTVLETWTSRPFSGQMDVTRADNGLFTYTARATDAAGNVGVSSAVNVTIDIPAQNADGGTDSGVATDGGAQGDAGDAGDAGVVIAPVGTKRVFVTEGVYTGDLKSQGSSSTSGPDGADRICAQEALAATLGGTWKAWIRESSVGSGALRVGVHGPWARLGDRALVFAGSSASGLPLVPINRTSLGNEVSAAQNTSVFSAINNDGSMKNPHVDCEEWTSSSSGHDSSYGNCTTMHNWSSTGTNYCNHAARLYCFEQ